MHYSTIDNSIHTLVNNRYCEFSMGVEIQRKNVNITSLQQDLNFIKENIVKKDNEHILVKAQNFDINQRLTKFVKENDAPYIVYTFSLPNTKL